VVNSYSLQPNFKHAQNHTSVNSANPDLLSRPPRSCGEVKGETCAANPYKYNTLQLCIFSMNNSNSNNTKP